MKRAFSLMLVCSIGLALAACTFATAAEAAPMLAAAAQSVDPGGAAAAGMAMALGAAGVTASPSLQATEDYSAARATAPRVSLADMEAKILGRHYFTAGEAVEALEQPGHPSLSLLTICILVMENGFSVIGKSAPASAENFDAEKGRTFAYEDAIRQLWPLEGYALRERLAAG